MIKYDVPPFSIAEITTLDANLLTSPLPVPPPVQRIAKFLPADESNVDTINYDPTFTLSATIWLTCEIGDGEGGIIGRDDGLCDIINYLARMDRYCRNNKQDATAKITRVNRTDCLNGVPLVFTSEKITSLEEAEEDLQRKFRWLPHFAELPFVFGIAITQDELSISRFRSDGAPMQRLFKADLTSPSGRWNCIISAVNVARVIKRFAEGNKLVSLYSSLHFDIWHERETKRLRLGLQCFENEYQSEIVYERMVSFYHATAHIPHLEHLYEGAGPALSPYEYRIKLQPVGVRRKPTTLPELLKCLHDITRALSALHEMHYYHCDVRWSNIVECFGAWYLIDCEYACCEADGDALLRTRAAHIRPCFVLDPTAPWSAAHDWYQVGLLLSEIPGLVGADKSLKTLCEKLLSKTFKVAAVQKLVNNLKSI